MRRAASDGATCARRGVTVATYLCTVPAPNMSLLATVTPSQALLRIQLQPPFRRGSMRMASEERETVLRAVQRKALSARWKGSSSKLLHKRL